MGGSSSRQISSSPEIDTSQAKYDARYVEELAAKSQQAHSEAAAAAAAAAASASRWKYGSIFIGILALVIIGVVIWYFMTREHFSLNPADWWASMFAGPSTSDLSIQSAKIQGKSDITSAVTNKISNSRLNVRADESIGLHPSETLDVRYQYPKSAPKTISVKYGEQLSILPDPSKETASSWSWSQSTGNLLPSAKDAMQPSSVTASSAPLSGGKEGAYGYQFWMYIKDWNYKFGQEKHVISRSDPTNVNIQNPGVTLHPTDNTMKVSVSVFPSTAGGSKAEPAPAGHSGSSDDVYVCEIPDIPLQTWTLVSISVSSRNLDVYLDSKLVKSCVLSGVPKPAAGDIELNKDGGFSGYMCSFYHYSKMLQPSDAGSLYASGVPCSIPGTSVKPGKFNVTFGLFDAKGTEVSKYLF